MTSTWDAIATIRSQNGRRSASLGSAFRAAPAPVVVNLSRTALFCHEAVLAGLRQFAAQRNREARLFVILIRSRAAKGGIHAALRTAVSSHGGTLKRDFALDLFIENVGVAQTGEHCLRELIRQCRA